MILRSASILLAFLISTTAVVAQRPPKDLHLVGDHWTAWQPPTDFPPDAELYTIVVGDTLWDLAGEYLGDPYLWPQLWERNQYILDAHWIYPGDPLLLGLKVTTPEQEELYTEDISEPVEQIAADPTTSSPDYPFVQLGHADDIYCSGYIGDADQVFEYHVSGSEYEILGPSFDLTSRDHLRARFGDVDSIKYGLSLGDIVYLDRGRESGLRAGDTFTSVQSGEIVKHPYSGKKLGRFYKYLGRIRVVSVQEGSAIGEIVHSCSFIPVGSDLIPFVSEPIPSKRKRPMRPATYPVGREALDVAAVIVHAKDGLVVMGKDHVIFLDRGEGRAFEVGDILTVYRRPPNSGPPVLLGEVAVLSVKEGNALAKVIASRYPMYVGDLALIN